MGVLEGLIELNDSLPPAAQIILALVLVLVSLVSIYTRINLDFGEKVFSNLFRDEIRGNLFHVIKYTVIPVAVCLGYIWVITTPGNFDKVEEEETAVLEDPFIGQIAEVDGMIKKKRFDDALARLREIQSEGLSEDNVPQWEERLNAIANARQGQVNAMTKDARQTKREQELEHISKRTGIHASDEQDSLRCCCAVYKQIYKGRKNATFSWGTVNDCVKRGRGPQLSSMCVDKKHCE